MESQKPLASITAARRPLAAKRSGRGSRKAWILRGVLAALILLAGGGAAWYFIWGRASTQASAASQAASETKTATVTVGSIVISASGSGTLVARDTVDLSFSTGGTVSELNVKVGDTVKAGDVLARLSSSGDLEAGVASAELQVLEAKQALKTLQDNAGLSLAQAYQAWVTAQETYDEALRTSQRTAYARCGQDVNLRYAAALERAKQKIAAINPSDYGSDAYINAKSDLDTAQANVNYCGSYTAVEKASAQSKLDVATVDLQNAEKTYNTLKAASGIDPNELALAESKVTQAETQRTAAQEKLDGIVLKAPMDGKVTFLAAKAGAIVDTTKYITIADVSHPTVSVAVDETDMDKLVVGKPATVVFDALPDQKFTGTVVQVDAALTVSGQYRVAKGLVELDPAAAQNIERLPLGLNASVSVISQQANDVLVVPVSALKDLGDNQYAVMVKGSDGALKLQTVQVGIKDSSYAEVTSGLTAGEVVTTGTIQASSGNSTNSSSSQKNGPVFDGPPPEGGVFIVNP